MRRKSRERATPAHVSEENSLVHEVLLRTVQILTRTGYSPDLLDRTYAEVRRQVRTATAPSRVDASYASKLAEVLGRWYTERPYVDPAGSPVSLPLKGSGRSLSRLVREVFPELSDQDTIRVIQALVRAGAIRRSQGYFVAANRYVSFAENPELAHAHSLDALRRYLRTVQHNISTDDPSRRLLERSATNDTIPEAALPTIHRRFKREVGALLFRMDRYMRGFQARRGRVTTVSLTGYASEDPLITGTAVKKRRVRRSRVGT
jgi:hypothetical protein